MIPVSLSRTVEYEYHEVCEHVSKRVLVRIRHELAKQKAEDIQVVGQAIRFRGGMLRVVWSTNALVSISRGRVSVFSSRNCIRVKYQLWFTQMLAVSAVIGCVVGLALADRDTLSISEFLIESVAVFVFFYAGNLLFALASFTSLLDRAMRDIS